MTHDDLAQLAAQLLDAARDYELEAARAREFIPDRTPASREVQYALHAAVAEGTALGLRKAAALITKWLKR